MNGLLSIIGMKTEMEYQMSNFSFGFPSFRFNVPRKEAFLLINRSVSQRRSMSSPSRVLRLWQLQRKMPSKSLIIVKSKEICYTKQDKGQRLMDTLRVFSMQNLKSIKHT